jgi:sirohydrochlorin cobaltochelatase
MNAKSESSSRLGEDHVGVLVVGHGTRDAAGIAEFHEVVRRLTDRQAPRPVEAGFLELAEPTIAAAVDRLLERGVRRMVVAPLVLFAAGHAKRDIPDAVAAAVGGAGDLTWTQTAPLGLHPQIIELSEWRYDEAVAGLPPVAPSDAMLIVVGRGSSDPQAVAETHELARRRAARRPLGRVVTAFTAMSEPLLENVLREAASLPFRQVIVQPHLLFAGELVERVRRRTTEIAESASEKVWHAAPHLGPHALVIDVLVSEIAACEHEQRVSWHVA